jgi:hypothetical protein
MAKLILTQKEKDATFWADLDNEALGKVVKAYIYRIKTTSEQLDKLVYTSAAILLCSVVADGNVGKAEFELGGLTRNGKNIGNWKLTIKQVPQKRIQQGVN